MPTPPVVRPTPAPAAGEAPPLLLLPMRLEYRVVEAGATPTMANTAAERAACAQALAATRSRPQGAAARRRLVSQTLRKPFTLARARQTATEIWFRWYPDDAFVEGGIAAATADEQSLLAQCRALMGARRWWDVGDATVAAAWQAFARAVGPQRAVHLLRTAGAAAAGWEARVGRIAALPSRVELFALSGSTLASIGTGAAIPANAAQERSAVSYTYEAVETGGWIADFGRAIELGMGLTVTGADAVAASLAADWVIAVGVSGDAGRTEIEGLLRDRIANGEFEFLPQDAPTNNSPGERSVLVDPRNDLSGFVAIAAQQETGALAAASGDTAAGLLSTALGIDPAVLRTAPRAADGALEDARAMLRVVGPALIDQALEGLAALKGIDEHAFIEAMAASVSPRGTLPPIRAGRNAYGIVVMSDVRTLTTTATGATRTVHEFLRGYAGMARQLAPAHADRVVPVLRPGDPAASDTLETILKSAAVSVRVDVADSGSDETVSIGCPYVEGSADDRKPASYLKLLRTAAIAQLPDPTSEDRTWPLLYRLARLAVTRAARAALDADLPGASKLTLAGFVAAKTTSFPKLNAAALKTLKTNNTAFANGLTRLEAIAARDTGTAQLETLMMEVIDLFQHRIDAWATGLAVERLRARRQQAPKAGLQAGYFGFIGKLRPTSVTGTTGGYLQAPSMGQAVAAAVLRSAYLRHREGGAFAIDLRSRRARRAMALLDLLKKGNSLNEALGMRAERWLHDRTASGLTLALRAAFPLQNVEALDGSAQPAQRRICDGLALLNGTPTGLTAAELKTVGLLKAALADDLDALSDLVVAEAVYQRGLGAADAANAWLQVLSGDPVPGDPAFLRTQRSGQGSTYRIALAVAEATAPAGAGPRSIAEPSVAKLADDALPGFAAAVATVAVSRRSNPAQRHAFSVGLRTDLGMEPIDLVIGGAAELQLRLRHAIVERWLRDGLVAAALGSLPASGLDAVLAADVEMSVDLSLGTPSVQSLLGRAETLRRAAHGRAIEPADLNAAALPAHVLDEATEVRLTAGAVARLRTRAQALGDRLAADLAGLALKRASFIRLAALAGSAPPTGGAQMAARIEADAARRDLMDVYRRVSAWAEPATLRSFTLDDALADLPALEERLLQVEARLAERRAGLSGALATTPAGTYASLPDARSARATLVAAIRGALDGDALPVLPSYERVEALQPQLAAATDAAAHLAPWAAVRPAVSRAVAAAALDSSLRAYPVAAAATADDAGGDADPRGESGAPRAMHFGVFIGAAAPVTTSARVLGLVVDEWAEQRPAETQPAAMAINYDSPQAEAPQTLLLCVPPGPSLRTWTAKHAAAMVVETIAWMKIRALDTSDKLTPSALLPRANQIAYRRVGAALEARLPRQRFGLLARPWFEGEGAFVRAEAGAAVGLAGAGVNQRSGFFRVKE